jgi:hypothetical protein
VNGEAVSEFYKAAATVIPTLMIAVVFTGRVIDEWKLELDDNTSADEVQHRVAEYMGGVTFVAWVFFTSIVGEGAALAALLSGVNPPRVYTILVVIAITFQLTTLGRTVLAQAISRVEAYDTKKARRAYVLLGTGLLIFVVLIMLSDGTLLA